METIKNRQCFIHGKKQAKYLLIQPIDEHDLDAMEEEIETINKTTSDYLLVGILVNDWQRELSPWYMQALFGNEDFQGGADVFYHEVKEVVEEIKVLYDMHDAHVIIGGYSLAGLFALYAGYQDAYDSLNGTVLYDGDDNITILFDGSDHYGGIYLRGNSLMLIITYDRSSSEIDDMLDMLGLTKP